MNNEDETVGISRIQTGGAQGGGKPLSSTAVSRPGKQDGGRKSADYDCKKCGTKHVFRNCPAWTFRCGKCGGKGHYNRFCPNKPQASDSQQVNAVHPVDHELFIGKVDIEEEVTSQTKMGDVTRQKKAS